MHHALTALCLVVYSHGVWAGLGLIVLGILCIGTDIGLVLIALGLIVMHLRG